jgi:hypothetical protein
MPYELEQYELERDNYMVAEYMKVVAPKTKLIATGEKAGFNHGVITGTLKQYFADQPVNFDTIEAAVAKASEMGLLHYEPAPPVVIEKIVEVPAKPKPLVQMEKRKDNVTHADRMEMEERIQKAREANPLNDPAFLAKQRNAEAEVRQIIGHYQVYTNGKLNVSRTNEHKEILNSARIESYLTDKDGKRVVLWDQTLQKITELIKNFERKREYSR